MNELIMLLEAAVIQELLTICSDEQAAEAIGNWGTVEGIVTFRTLTSLQQSAILLAAAKRIKDHAE